MNKEAEQILVLERERVFENGTWQGVNPNEVERIVQLASNEGEFRRRGDVERDSSLKQVVPYVVFRYDDRYLLMQRKSDHTEQRLAGLYSCGIGGHLRKEDLEKGEDILDWAEREFAEEVDYQGRLDLKVVGALNDDTNPVGEVHLGVIIIASGDSPQIKVKDEHKSGKLVALQEALEYYDQMENWSKFVFEYLRQPQVDSSSATF